MSVPVELKILDCRLGAEFPLPDYATIASAGARDWATSTASSLAMASG